MSNRPDLEAAEAEWGREEVARRFVPPIALELLADIVRSAKPRGEDEDGRVLYYWIPTGPIHRAVPFLDQHGIDRLPLGTEGTNRTVPWLTDDYEDVTWSSVEGSEGTE